ncbi:tRNA (N6-threonylcarbamoyladenosine(37)-N6)-methyltransferase TrmO [Saccharophagus degradans]|uniref:tRNA (N6-threonylcarbamoyladenosine(37)-N6)-methyltransferase TrmO n=1 Tax=Saccharophagus degradans TaxID=86304 RepID=A0AAW7X4E7_9GAMM|nr:tRNA (N6-threonylcarbamoyladenosine(37)-N6)-methyltransferase TrmO [Saccharophagus degradans]MDO6422425.1 tRNA (N6-threonylcarbamoyladenosine(37)-N6)-methyltransferase TrmO [Saccharophagus degradans]MDO6608035.1 tRNA (N6-threonylcarbamoyladenosine(37)-N6)-methyltransferase TrmO [Saccharophagus degradans]
MQFTLNAIGKIHTCYKQKFGIPRQAGLSPSAEARIEIFAPYNRIEAFEELKQSSHIWVHFVFHENRRTEWKPKVKAPRLGGNKTIGVFATRSPVRPNPIGLSAVRLEAIEHSSKGLFLVIRGGDFLDGTPVVDIKPYVPYCDKIDNATNGFAADAPATYSVQFDEEALDKIRAISIANLEPLIIETLQLNPAPQYQTADTSKTYALRLFDYDIHWQLVSVNAIRVTGITKAAI